MKKVVIIIGIFLIIGLEFISSVESKKYEKNLKVIESKMDVTGPDFFKNELNSAILGFAEDTGLDPDSVYFID